MRREIRLRHYSLRTEEAYVDWIKRFIHFHKAKAAPHPSAGGEASGWRHPRDMGAAEVRQFLEHLAADRNVAAPTQHQALNALVFLYHGVLKIKLGELGEYLRANKPAHLPVVLARPEAQRLLAALPGTHQLIGQLLYGTGMRLLECLRLRIKDVDFERNQITVRDGKGFKDRVTMLPDKLKGELPSPLPSGHGAGLGVSDRETLPRRSRMAEISSSGSGGASAGQPAGATRPFPRLRASPLAARLLRRVPRPLLLPQVLPLLPASGLSQGRVRQPRP